MKQKCILFSLCLLCVASLGTATAELTTIWDIRLGTFEQGTEVTVENVVVTASGFYGFFIQEQGEHPIWGRRFSGIFVHTHGPHMGSIQKGDVVNVTGAYQEYYDLSEIDVYYSPCGDEFECFWEEVGTAPVPDPIELHITDVNDAGPYAEDYESVLIRVDSEDDELYAGEPWYNAPSYEWNWTLYTGPGGTGDSISINQRRPDPEQDFDYPLPEEGDVLTYVQGILIYNWEHYRIAPRDCINDLGMPCPPLLQGMWAYESDRVQALFALPVEEQSAENPDNYYFENGLEVYDAVRDNNNHRLVHIYTEEMAPGWRNTGYAENIESIEGVPMPEPGSFDFVQGITPLSQIQEVTDVLADSSTYTEEVVTVEGRVTAVDGSYVYLQNEDGGPWQHLYARVPRTDDVAVGDSVKVAGAVEEYYGLTELGTAVGVACWENMGPAMVDPMVTDVNAYDIFYDADARDEFGDPLYDNRPEPWESALLRCNQNTVMDTVSGGAAFGEWFLIAGADSAMTDIEHRLNDYGDNIYYEPIVGDTAKFSGILDYSYSHYLIAPRHRTDIEIIYAPGTGVDDLPVEIARVMLNQNRPNPFGPATTIGFSLSQGTNSVDVGIYDVTGAKVRTLLRGAALTAGPHAISWDGNDDHGQPMTSGTYYCRITADGRRESKPMQLLR